jgi:predicted RNA-binding Zn-ribbon protein involved in translation (DUF1610 family)
MVTVRQCGSLLEAVTVAAYLRSCGIPAASAVPSSGLLVTYTVFVADENVARQARDSLREMDASGIELADGWEAQAEPDLAKLPERYMPACSCGYRLPLRSGEVRCPECGTDSDVAALVVEQFGPEAMELCYPSAANAMSDEQLETLALACACGYSLGGLAVSGTCPECGAAYEKRELLAVWEAKGLI